MVVGEYPFPMQGNIMLLFEDIAAGKYEVPDWVDPDCADLIKLMLRTNPVERIDLDAIRTHPFVKNTPAKKEGATVPIPAIHSMWPHHDKSSLSSVIKKMRPQLEREEEMERAARVLAGEEEEEDYEGDSGSQFSSSRNPDDDDDRADFYNDGDDPAAHDDPNGSSRHSDAHASRRRRRNRASRNSPSRSSKCSIM